MSATHSRGHIKVIRRRVEYLERLDTNKPANGYILSELNSLKYALNDMEDCNRRIHERRFISYILDGACI